MDAETKATNATKFVHHIMAELCSNPERLVTEFTIDEKGILIKAWADPKDCGRLIGKKGDTIQAIRTVLRALGTKDDARYSLKIDNFDS